MNKNDLIDNVVEKTDLTKRDTEKIINAMLDSIENSLAQGEKVQLMGFGSFKIKVRAAKVGRNPQTGDKITIPSSVKPIFKAGKVLRKAVLSG